MQSKYFNNNRLNSISISNESSSKTRRVVVDSRCRIGSFKKKKCKTVSRRNRRKSKINGSNKNVKQSTRIMNAGESKLRCVYFNARSIVNKHKELEMYVLEEKFDIVGITETWLYSEISDSEMSIDGYTLLRNDRNDAEKHRGGGVALYVHNDLNCVHRDDLYEQNFPETVWCNISCNGDNTLVGVCYRAPNSMQINDEALYSLISRVSEEVVVIMGDFNFPELDWGRPESINDSHPFIECMSNNFLTQAVDEPTRLKNYLDLVLCSDPSLIDNVSVEEPFETSDHQIVTFNIAIKERVCKHNKQFYNYFKADYETMRQYARSKNWDSLIGISADEIWLILQEDLVEIRNKFVPSGKPKINKCKWATRRVKKLRLDKKRAWLKYVNSGKDNKLYEIYKEKLRKSVQENNNAKIKFEQNLANNIKQDSKSFYSYVRSKQRSKVRVGPLKDSAGNIVSDSGAIADLLNSYFSSVFTVENISSIPNPISNFDFTNSQIFSDISVDEKLVYGKLSKMNISKSQGPDELNPKLIFELRNELCKPLTYLFNMSIQTGVIPQDWRDAIVAPLHKKGSKNKSENYRPVSLTSIISKLLESIVKDNLVKHLDKYALIRSSQHGFTSGKSCLSNLLDFLRKLQETWMRERL